MNRLSKILHSGKLYLYVFQLLSFTARFLIIIAFNKLEFEKKILLTYEDLLLIKTTFSVAVINAAISTLLQFYKNARRKTFAIGNILLVLLGVQIIASIPLIKLHPDLALPFGLFMLIDNAVIFGAYFLFIEKKNSRLLFFSLGYFSLLLIGIILSTYYFGLRTAFYIVSGLLAVFSVLVLKVSYFNFSLDLIKVKYFFSLMFPLLLMFFMTSGADQMDSWIVKLLGEDKDFLIFRYGARELPMTLMLANVISASNVILLKRREGNLSSIRRNSRIFTWIAFPIAMVLMLFSKELFLFLYKQELAEAYEIFNIFLLLVIPRALFPQSILLAKNKNRILFYNSVLEFFIHIVFSIVGFVFLGIKGVAFSALLAYSADKTLLAYYCNKYLNISFSQYTDVKTLLLFSLALLVVFISKTYILS